MYKCEVRLYEKDDVSSNQEIKIIRSKLPEDYSNDRIIVLDIGKLKSTEYVCNDFISRVIHNIAKGVAIILVYDVTEETAAFGKEKTIRGVTFGRIYTEYYGNDPVTYYYSNVYNSDALYIEEAVSKLHDALYEKDMMDIYTKVDYNSMIKLIDTILLEAYYCEKKDVSKYTYFKED